jgi:ankyrin repeat protein
MIGRPIETLALVLVMACVSSCAADAVAKVAPLQRCEAVAPSAQLDPYDPESIRKHWKDGPPIVLAMGADRHDKLSALLARGQDPNVCLLGFSPLSLATANGDLEEMRILLDAGADADRPRDASGGTPLLNALGDGHYDAARLLIARGADVRVVADGGVTALYALANAYELPEPSSAQVDMAQTLIDRGAAVDTQVGQPRTTPLMMASIRGRTGLVRFLLAHGADPTLRDYKGQTALAFATKKGHAAVAEVLAAAMASAATASSAH